MNRDKFLSWVAMKKIENPKWIWDCHSISNIRELISLFSDKPKYCSENGRETLDPTATVELALSLLWNMKIYSTQCNEVFFNKADPEIYKNDEQLSLILWNYVVVRVFHNVVVDEIDDSKLLTLRSTLYDVNFNNSGHLCYNYREQIDQYVFDFDIDRILISSRHRCHPFWNSKTKRLVPARDKYEFYLVENSGSTIVVSKLLALGTSIDPKILMRSAYPLLSLDKYEKDYCSKVISKVSL